MRWAADISNNVHPVIAASGPDPSGRDASRRERFTGLYEDHYDRILRYAWRRVGRDQAEDVASETFAVLWKRLDDAPSDPDLLPWLYTVARNLVLSGARKAAKDARPVAAADGLPEADHADAVIAREHALAALRSLSEQDRELVMLVAWEGLGPREAAAVLGCRTSAIYLRMHRLRRRLEKMLDPSRREDGKR
jgi:RNA polymerase sigma-70 factor, ECF subfamily